MTCDMLQKYVYIFIAMKIQVISINRPMKASRWQKEPANKGKSVKEKHI